MKPLKMEQWTLDKLKPFDKNPRTHPDEQIVALCKAIGEFGFTDPILVSSSGGILAGHGRYAAALRLYAAGKLETVPVIMLDHLDATKQKAFLIAHNKLAEKSSWHKDYLSMLVQELKSIEYELDFLAMNSDELDRLMVQEVVIPEIQITAVTTETQPAQQPTPKVEAPAQQPVVEKKAEPLPTTKLPAKEPEKKEIASPKKSFTRCPNCSHEW